MDLEVVGRHALFFDDDSAAAFVNSAEALLEWNSLLIDRYDVRHLLSAPPPRRRTHSPPRVEAEIDVERYLDLHLPARQEEKESDVGATSVEPGGYHSVAFAYGISVNSNEEKNLNDGMGDFGFCPPFPVPESLLQCLPPTEKLHQIIARTALFVSKNGGQSEIVLRVKQGDNPTFGFLMPDHHLHPYFRYLIDHHHDLLKSDLVEKFENKDHSDKTSGALSLLSSVYGSGDDEDVAIDNISESKENESRKSVDASVSLVRHGSQETGILAKANERDAAISKHSSSEKDNIHVLKKNSLMKVSKAGIPTGKKKEPPSTFPSTTVNTPSSSVSVNSSTVEAVILEPPSDIKKLVDRVVEFILKNGPQCEAVLTEQDSKYGRFPFLLRSNQFNSYYVNVLRKAQESKLSGKSFSEKDNQMVSRLEKKSSLGKKQSESLSLGSASGDIPYDYDRKEKFKMVLGKSKKDGDGPPSTIPPSPHGYVIDAAQTAAILQAATRGIKSSHFVPNISLNGDIRNEAEAHMTKEQKLKAERLKRAKMFVSMLKSGAAPSKSETPRALSMELQEPVVSGKEGEDSSVTLHVETSVSKDESEKKLSDSEIHERISKRKYRSKSGRYDGEEERDGSEDGEEERDGSEDEEEEEKEKNDKHFRKKHQSHRSSRENGKEDEEDKDYMHGKRKHRSHRSSREKGLEEEVAEEDRDYRHDKRKRRSRHTTHDNEEEEDEEDRDYRHGNRKHRSRRSSRESGIEEDEEDRDYRHGKRKHRSHRSSRESDIEEDEEERDYRHGKRKHRSHRSSHKDEKEEDDDERDHKKLRKKHKSRHSSDEDDFKERLDKHSKKKNRSHHSSRRSKDKHKDRKQHSFSGNRSPDDENNPTSSYEKPRNISQSVEDLEEGEISSKSSGKSRGSMGRGANREASVDVLSSYRDGRGPSQPSEATEVPDDLRAKIRAMLMANF